MTSCSLGLLVDCAAANPPLPTRSTEAVYGFTDDAGLTHLTNLPDDDISPHDYRVLVAAPIPLPVVTASDLLPGKPLRDWADQAANRSRIDPALLLAVMRVESGFNARAVSPKGAKGLMQLMPATASRYGVSDPFDARASIFASASHLRDLLDEFQQDISLAVAAYNAGSAAVSKFHNSIPPYAETRAYVPRVLNYYARLKAGDLP